MCVLHILQKACGIRRQTFDSAVAHVEGRATSGSLQFDRKNREVKNDLQEELARMTSRTAVLAFLDAYFKCE